jgi:histidinol phosphatase-like enzyme
MLETIGNITLAMSLLSTGFILGALYNTYKDDKWSRKFTECLYERLKTDDALKCVHPKCQKRRKTPNGLLKQVRNGLETIHKREDSVYIGSLERDMGFTKEEAIEAKFVVHDGAIYIHHPNHPVIKVSSGLEWVNPSPKQQVTQSNKEAAESVSEPKIHPRYQEVKDAAERSIGVDTQDTTESTE